MRIVKPLTDAQIEAAKPRDKTYRLFDGGGLYLEVLPTGGKSWRMKYRIDGGENRVTFGQYPEISLKDARKKREETRNMVAAGIDPISYRKQLEAEKAAAELRKTQTFENIACEWFAKQTCSPAYLSKVQAQIGKYAFPNFGHKHMDEVERQDVLDVARAIERLGAIESARRFIQRVGQILRYGMDAGYNRYDVTVGLVRAIAKPPEKHRNFIQDKKRIGELLRAIDAYGGTPQVKAALTLAPLLMPRPSELARAKWQEIDWDAREWHIPAKRMKMRGKHIVPLCRQALEILKMMWLLTGSGDYIFPSPKTAKKPITTESMTQAIRAMGFTPDELHIHGLRSMASTILNERGYNRDWIERQLSHGDKDKIRATYNYAEYLAQRHKMMQEWADFLDGLRGGQKTDL